MDKEFFRVPIPDEIKKAGNNLARTIHERTPADTGFILFLAPFGDRAQDDWVFYISNVNREDAMKIVKNYLTAESAGLGET